MIEFMFMGLPAVYDLDESWLFYQVIVQLNNRLFSFSWILLCCLMGGCCERDNISLNIVEDFRKTVRFCFNNFV